MTIQNNRPCAMILAAGLGTRFKPWTDLHPKALAMVNGKSLLQRNVQWLQQFGIRDVIVNVHHFADQIEDAIRESGGWGSTITISDERNEVLETGGGLKKAAWYFSHDAFVLVNVDILSGLDLAAMRSRHQSGGSLATLAVTDRNTSRNLLFDAGGRLCGWKNNNTGEEKGPMADYSSAQKKALIPKAFSGIHVINPRLLSLIQRTGKFSMIDLYLDLAATERIDFFDHSGSTFIDVGKPDSVAEAEKIFP